MTTVRTWLAPLLTCALLGALCLTPVPVAAQPNTDDAQIAALLDRLEEAVLGSNRDAYLALLSASANRVGAGRFVDSEFRPSATKVTVQERERLRITSLPAGTGYLMTVDAFVEIGDRARVATWALDLRRDDQQQWHIFDQKTVSTVENIYRLTVNARQQFDVKNFTIVAEDLELTMAQGSVFTVDTDQGITGLVLLGQGEMNFHPTPRTEIEQVRIYAGADRLESRFDAAYVRLGTFESHADRNLLVPRAAVDPRDLRRAQDIFREESAKSFIIDLADLTRDTWSLLLGSDDFLAEIRTRRWDTLTYARSNSEAEDITLFERKRQKNIAVYASKDKELARGRFYNEDDLSPYDVLDYQIDSSYNPERQFLDGQTVMQVRVRAENLGQITLRLNNTLAVRSITSDRFGRLFYLRVANQNTVLINLPQILARGDDMTLTVGYAGRIDPQDAERELISLQNQTSADFADEPVFPKMEQSFLYSNRSYWHPQPAITDYATATISITVPQPYAVVASGTIEANSPVSGTSVDNQPARTFTFNAERPLRYLAFLVTKLTRADKRTVTFDQKAVTASAANAGTVALEDAVYDRMELTVEAHQRQQGRGRNLADRAEDIVKFYETLIGDSPYGTFTLAVIEGQLPGGHSPGYFAALNQVLSTSTVTWRNDPAAFQGYPEFFLAHELAHQWWGQAVGWRNYHEQWLSEGFAQYFAALYAEKFRGGEIFGDVMKQMSRWAMQESPAGPVYLGYRVGHIKNDSRSFRAIVYNKGAVVVHMLRLLVGDDAFFRGVRRFYSESRFSKVGTDSLRQAMEEESGQPLDRFFERWIYNSSLPRVAFTYRVEGQEAVLQFEQGDEVFDLPIVVTLTFADRREVTVVVPVTDKSVEHRVPLQGTLVKAEIDRDAGVLAELVKN
jgi:hypothetical protein